MADDPVVFYVVLAGLMTACAIVAAVVTTLLTWLGFLERDEPPPPPTCPCLDGQPCARHPWRYDWPARRSPWTALAAAIGAALFLATGAAAGSSPIPGTLGLRLQPAPVHVDDVRTFTATNLSGGLALNVTLTAEPATYAVEPARFTLEDGATQEVAIVSVDPKADGRITARGTATTAGGAVTSAVSVSTRLVHAGPLIPEPVLWGLYTLFALVAVVLLSVAVRRIRR